LPDADPILRRSGQSFVDAAVASDLGGDTDNLAINAGLFGCDLNPQDGVDDGVGCGGAQLAIALAGGGPQDPLGWPNQGRIVVDAEAVSGVPYESPGGNLQRRWLAVTGRGNAVTWRIGEGDQVPLSATSGFSGGRSFAVPFEGAGDGVTSMGFLPDEKLLFVIVQEDEAAANVALAEIEQAYDWLGVADRDRVLWDSGSSSTLVFNRDVIAPPGSLNAPGFFADDVKNWTIPVGIAMYLPGNPCTTGARSCDPNGG